MRGDRVEAMVHMSLCRLDGSVKERQLSFGGCRYESLNVAPLGLSSSVTPSSEVKMPLMSSQEQKCSK